MTPIRIYKPSRLLQACRENLYFRRFFIILAAFLACTSILLTLVSAGLTYSHLYATAEDSVVHTVGMYAGRLRDTKQRGEQIEGPLVLGSDPGVRYITRLTYYDDSGRLVWDLTPSGQVRAPFFTSWWTRHIEYPVRPNDTSEVLGILSADWCAYPIFRISSLTALSTLLLSLLLGSALAYLALCHIYRLTEGVAAISNHMTRPGENGRPDEIVVEDEWPTEVQDLAEALNTLARSSNSMSDQFAAIATEQRRLSQQMLVANESLHTYRNEITAVTAHEVRTPLSAMMGYTQLARSKLGEGDMQAVLQALDTVEEQGRSALSLVNDMLDFSRIKSGQAELQFRAFDLCDLLKDIYRKFALLASARGNTLELVMDLDECRVCMDRERIGMAISNIISNANKYTENGRIEIVLMEDGQDVSIHVVDSGKGFDMSDADKVFEPYVQCDMSASRPHDGLGLGLALVNAIVTLHGGRVDACSQIGSGSQFWISLPKNAASLAAQATHRP